MGGKAGVVLILISLGMQAAQANELGGIRLDMTEQEALRALRVHGEPQPLSPQVRGYRAGGFNFVLCRGFVDNVNHRLQATFMAFARTATRATDRYGEPTESRVDSEETERPLGIVAFGWSIGNYVYSVEYLEVEGQPYVNETMAHSIPCNERG